MSIRLDVQLRHLPVIDPGFLPAVLWNRAYAARVRASRGASSSASRSCARTAPTSRHAARILPPTAGARALNRNYVERLRQVPALAEGRRARSSSRAADRSRACSPRPTGRRARAPSTGTSSAGACSGADRGEGGPREAAARPRVARSRSAATSTAAASASTSAAPTASARRVVDGKVVFSDEVVWNPYFEKDPCYHFEGINDTLRRAARAPAAHRRDRRQRGRRLREQRAARGLALPRDRRARLRPPHPRPLPRAPAVVGRRAVRGRERRRGDGARRLDVDAARTRCSATRSARAPPPVT